MKYTKTENENSFLYGIEIPKPVAMAVTAGKAVLNMTLAAKGAECTVLELAPGTAHLAMSLEAATLHFGGEPSPEGSIPEFDESSGSDISIEMTKSDIEELKNRPAVFYKKDGTFLKWMTSSDAAERVEKRNLNKHRVNGVLNFYAEDSLVKQDFKRENDDDFLARVTYVASAIGAAKAISRIATNQGLQISGCDNIEEWWSRANCMQKATLLTTRKKLDIAKHDLKYERLNALASPFWEAGVGAFSG